MESEGVIVKYILLFALVFFSSPVLAQRYWVESHGDQLREVKWETTVKAPALFWLKGYTKVHVDFPLKISSVAEPSCSYYDADTGKRAIFKSIETNIQGVTFETLRGARITIKCVGYEYKLFRGNPRTVLRQPPQPTPSEIH